MKDKNICKFISPVLFDTLSVSCFVLESNVQVMKIPSLLTNNRLILVTQGEGNFVFDDTRVSFSSGSIIFGFKKEKFFAEVTKPCEYMYISFDGIRGAELLRRFGINLANRRFDGFDGLIPLWRESLSRACEQTIDLASESILLYTFSRLSGQTTLKDSLINKILEISEENFSNPELSLSTLAEELGYNDKYVSHLFKEKMGVGYSEYLRSLRLKYAVSLFEHGIDSVKNVALLSGFTDPLYFSTVFKKETGVSPKEYRVSITNDK